MKRQVKAALVPFAAVGLKIGCRIARSHQSPTNPVTNRRPNGMAVRYGVPKRSPGLRSSKYSMVL